jgi:uncharacterized protein (TIGR02246 family)
MIRVSARLRWWTIGWIGIAWLAASPVLAEDVRSAIVAANDRWEAAAGRSDGAAVAALYTENAQLLPPQSDFVTGIEAIAAFWQGVFDSGVKGASLDTLEVERFGDTLNEVGKFELRDADGKVLDHGKYLVIWKREGDSWKLHRDIWTTSVVSPAE